MTNRTVTVKPSGGTYTSLAGAIAGELSANANLVSADIQLNIECYTMADTATVTVDGFTTDSTRYLHIYAPTSERHSGVWSDSKYRLTPTADAGYSLSIKDNYVRVTGLQIKNLSVDGGFWHGDVEVSATDLLVDSCVLANASAAAYGVGIKFIAGGTGAIVRNTVVYGATNNGFWVGVGSATAQNVTVVGSGGNGFLNEFGALAVTNCYSGGNASADYSSYITITTSASSDTSGSAGLQSIAVSVSAGAYFTNVTAGSQDYHIGASSGLRDAGTDLSGTFTLDINGRTRSGTWDIGADEYVAAAATFIFSEIPRGIRRGIQRGMMRFLQ
jgi:hypothetical protein